MTDADIEQYFGQFGKVVKISQMRWPDSGKKRGYGFVEFEDHDVVDKIVLCGKHFINGERMETKKALSKQEIAQANMGGQMGNNMGGHMGNNMGNRGMGFGHFRGGGMGNM